MFKSLTHSYLRSRLHQWKIRKRNNSRVMVNNRPKYTWKRLYQKLIENKSRLISVTLKLLRVIMKALLAGLVLVIRKYSFSLISVKILSCLLDRARPIPKVSSKFKTLWGLPNLCLPISMMKNESTTGRIQLPGINKWTITIICSHLQPVL